MTLLRDILTELANFPLLSSIQVMNLSTVENDTIEKKVVQNVKKFDLWLKEMDRKLQNQLV